MTLHVIDATTWLKQTIRKKVGSTEAVVPGGSVKKLFWKISQNSLKTITNEFFLCKVTRVC